MSSASEFWAGVRAALVGVGGMSVATAVHKANSIPAWPQYVDERGKLFVFAISAFFIFTTLLVATSLPDSKEA